MNFPDFEIDKSFASRLDDSDELKFFRKHFFISDEQTIYLDGNSLGRLPIKTKNIIEEVTQNQWGTELIESWNKHWYNKSVELGEKIATIIGAQPNEVIVCDSTSVNLYKLAFAALKYKKNKTKIVSDETNFPTDLYILQGIIKNVFPNHSLILSKSKDDGLLHENELLRNIDENTALVVLSMVSFKSSYLYDAQKITDFAHKKGALVLWDLSHAAGAIPVNLNRINADLAIGCTYKYLNGGPGAPAFLYVNKKIQEHLQSPVQGWFADENPFAFHLNFTPAKGIRKFLIGTPPVISLMAIEPGIDIINEAGIEKIYKKSQIQSEYFIFLVENILNALQIQIASPKNFKYRGSHVSIKHDEAYRICQALINPEKNKLKIIPDFREPNLIRFGFTPLYTTFEEIWHTVYRIKEIIEQQEFMLFSNTRKNVT